MIPTVRSRRKKFKRTRVHIDQRFGIRLRHVYLESLGNPSVMTVRYNADEDTVTLFPYKLFPEEHMSRYDAYWMNTTQRRSDWFRLPAMVHLPEGARYEVVVNRDKDTVVTLAREE